MKLSEHKELTASLNGRVVVLEMQNAALMAERDALRAAAQGLINYRDRAGALNFQLEKADDYIRQLRLLVEAGYVSCT